MFEKQKAKKAEEQYKAALSQWQSEHDELSLILRAAQTKQGSPSTDIVLKAGEAVFGSIANVSLVEDRKGKGHYSGGSSGVSIPIGSLGGRSVRYRVGSSRGHYVQGAVHPEAVDKGKLVITNRRAVFVGHKKTIESLFDKLVSANVDNGDLYLSVSNRQKVTRIHYGSNLDGWLRLRLTLAMSVGRGDSAQFATQLQAHLNELEASRPRPSVPA